MQTNTSLGKLFNEAIGCLANTIEQQLGGKTLKGIGLVTTDDLAGIAAFFNITGDFPDDYDAYLEYSPVEWKNSESSCFDNFNQELYKYCSNYSLGSHEDLVREVFDFALEAMSNFNLRDRFGNELYLTFSGTDPSDLLVQEESKFVSAMNSEATYTIWKEEFEI